MNARACPILLIMLNKNDIISPTICDRISQASPHFVNEEHYHSIYYDNVRWGDGRMIFWVYLYHHRVALYISCRCLLFSSHIGLTVILFQVLK